MDFKLTKAQQLQRELFRKFAETEIAPLAKEMDETEVYSQELVAKMQKYGFFGIPYSKEYGGVGGGCAEKVIAVSEFAKKCMSSAATLSIHLICPHAILK